MAATDGTPRLQGLTRQQVLWASILAKNKEKLVKVKAITVLDTQSHAGLQASLLEMQAQYAASTTTQFLTKLDPLLERLRGFTMAVSSFTNSDPTYSALVWGGVLVCLECASRFTNILSRITDMFDSLVRGMPRFETYMELYPNSSRLELALQGIYGSFTEFCVETIRFFYYRPILRLVSLMWSSVVKRFENAIKGVEKHANEFNEEARLAHDIAASSHRRLVEGVLPQVALAPKTAEHVFSVPFPPNNAFFGRSDDLDFLKKSLIGQSAMQSSCIIRGIGGVGKTQLALQFCYKFKENFPYIFWLRAQDESSLSESFAQVPELLGLIPSVSGDRLKDIEIARRWLSNHPNWLLIFDNAETPDLLNRYWPSVQHGSIILTTQHAHLVHRVCSDLELGSFSDKEGSDLLLQYLPVTADDEVAKIAGKISNEIGGLPLLLVGLAGFIKESYMTLQQTLAALQQSRSEARSALVERTASSTIYQYERSVETVFKISLSVLPSIALAVLNVMAMLSPDAMLESIFQTEIRNPTIRFINITDDFRFATVVRQSLAARHLIRIQQGENGIEYTMHRSLQWMIIGWLDEEPSNFQRTFDQAVALVHSKIPKPSPIMVPLSHLWKLFELYLPHVLRIHSVFVNASHPIRPTKQFAEVLCSAGAYLYERGLSKTCLEVLHTAEQVCQDLQLETEIVSEDKSQSVSSLLTLEANIHAYSAGIYWTVHGLKERKESHRLGRKVIELREKHLSETPPDDVTLHDQLLYTNALSDFGLQLMNEERYDEAERYHQESLERKTKLQKDGNSFPAFEFAVSLEGLGYVRLAQGRIKEAIELHERGIQILENEEGADLAGLEEEKFALANIYFNSSMYEKAENLHESILAARRELFGETSVATLHSFFMCSVSRYQRSDFTGALDYLSHCMLDKPETLWSEECVLRAKYLHCLALEKLGREGEILTPKEDIVQVRDKILAEHAEPPWTTPSSNVDDMVYFDHLVNLNCGRTTILQSRSLRHAK